MIKNKKIKVLMLAAEITPIAKIGGLGDVLGSLPPALAKIGCDARVILPLYGLVDRKKYKLKKLIAGLKIERRDERVNIWTSILPGRPVKLYWLEAEKFFSDKRIYAPSFSIHADSERFIFFVQAAFAALSKIGFNPDIIHCHDSHTALAPCLLKNIETKKGKRTKAFLTIHNLYHQSKARPRLLQSAGIAPDSCRTLARDAADGDINLMAQGILNADIITTVSPTYAKEILTPQYGAGLERLLRRRQRDIYGIVNGIDTDFFNPAVDRFIAKRYDARQLEKKSDNKLALQKRLGLPAAKDLAVIGIVSRLVWQKGLDMFTEKMVKALACQIVILGSGQEVYEKKLLALAKKYPEKINVSARFDEALAHLIYAGSDIFLMPSRFEPCGLGQMIAMRYGAVPIVRGTGGLKDTVKNFLYPISNTQKNTKRQALSIKTDATGFVFEKLDNATFQAAIQKALAVYYGYPGIWRQLQVNGMKTDWSWCEPAKKYLALYKKLV